MSNITATRIFHDADADPGALADKTVAVVGYGNQGRSQALNIRDSGVTTIVGNLDLAGELVPEHAAGRNAGRFRREVQVGAADPSAAHAEHELARPGRRVGEVCHHQRASDLLEDCGSHAELLPASTRRRTPHRRDRGYGRRSVRATAEEPTKERHARWQSERAAMVSRGVYPRLP